MKRQILGLLGVLLFVFCLLVVSWQLYQGTKKYMAEPLANKIYSAQAELPVITVCHADDDLKQKGMKHSDYKRGIFMSILENMTAEEVFEEATDYHYGLLDYTVEKKNCDISDSERIYKGQQNMTLNGKPCLKWSEVGKENSDEKHNYCRKPDKKPQEWCYFQGSKGRVERGYCPVVTCGHVEIKVNYVKKAEDLSNTKFRRYLKPYGTLWIDWGKCASYELVNAKKPLRVMSVLIESPVEIKVFLHSKGQSNIPRELSISALFVSQHKIQVSVEKTIDIYQTKKPCYNPEDHEGETYGDYDYKLLNNKIIEKFNCTTPFIPSKYRNGSKICSNEKGSSVYEFFKSTSASLSPNMWADDYHSIPPCVYNTYTMQETKTQVDLQRTIFLDEERQRKCKNLTTCDTITISNTKVMEIQFNSKMIVSEQFLAYGFLAYVAENGGFVGLFLGYSVLQLRDLMNYAFASQPATRVHSQRFQKMRT